MHETKCCDDVSCTNKTCDYQRYLKKPKSYSAKHSDHKHSDHKHSDLDQFEMVKQL